MILVPANKVEKIKYFSTLLGLIFIEITRGPFQCNAISNITILRPYGNLNVWFLIEPLTFYVSDI